MLQQFVPHLTALQEKRVACKHVTTKVCKFINLDAKPVAGLGNAPLHKNKVSQGQPRVNRVQKT